MKKVALGVKCETNVHSLCVKVMMLLKKMQCAAKSSTL